MSDVRLVLICGLPGSGKTTLSRRLAEEMTAVRLCEDEWMTHLGLDLYDELARDRLEELFWQLTQSLLRSGTSVILESGFWMRSDRDQKRLGARTLGAEVELHYLDVALDELIRRVETRYALTPEGTVGITREQLEVWSGLFQAPDPDELALFDATN